MLLLHYTFVVTWARLAYLFCNYKKTQSYIFGNSKGPFTPKVKLLHVTGEVSVIKWQNKVTRITSLKK